MPLPEGVHTVRYTLIAYDPEEETHHLSTTLTMPFNGSDLEAVDAAIEAGIQAIVDHLQPTLPVPIRVSRWYDAAVEGVFPTPPAEEVPGGDASVG